MAQAAAMSGAVDLSVLKERAEAKQRAAQAPASPAGDGSGAGGAIPAVFDVTEASFEADVLVRSTQVLVLVDLWATWCEPCKQLSPTLEALAEGANGAWVLAKVDIDENPRIAQAFGVQSVPTVIAIADGQPVAAFQGVQSAAQINGWVEEILAKVGGSLTGAPGGSEGPAPVDPRVEAAEALLADGDIDGALAQYREINAAEPGNTEAALAVRNLEFLVRAQGYAPGDSEGDGVDARLVRADGMVLAQQQTDAFDLLIETVKQTAGDERDRVRTRLLELLQLFDPADPDVVAARRKLARALY